MKLRIAAGVAWAFAALFSFGVGESVVAKAEAQLAQQTQQPSVNPPQNTGAPEVCTTVKTESVARTVCGSGLRIVEKCVRSGKATTKNRCQPS
jgi:hypothetical protein